MLKSGTKSHNKIEFGKKRTRNFFNNFFNKTGKNIKKHLRKNVLSFHICNRNSSIRNWFSLPLMLGVIFIAGFRSSHWRCSVKKYVPRNFTKFIGKHLCQSPFFNKVARLRSATLLKKRLWHRCFPMNFVKFLRIPFLQKTSERLLLWVQSYIRPVKVWDGLP